MIQFLYQTTCTEKLLTPFTIQKKFHSELHIFEVIETRNSAPGTYFTDPYARNLLHEVLELHFRGQTLHQRKIAHQTHVLQCKFVHQKPFYAKQLHLTPQATSWHQNRSHHHHGTAEGSFTAKISLTQAWKTLGIQKGTRAPEQQQHFTPDTIDIKRIFYIKDLRPLTQHSFTRNTSVLLLNHIIPKTIDTFQTLVNHFKTRKENNR